MRKVFNPFDARSTGKYILRLFVNAISEYGNDKMREAIDMDKSILKRCSVRRPGLLKIGRRISRRFRNYEWILDYQYVMMVLRKYRPEFYRIINEHPRGRQWLQRNIEEFRAFFFGD